MKDISRILIVDDDPAHRLLTRRAIAKHFPKLEILEANSAKNAVSLISKIETPPILIFLDLNLGEERGTSLLRYIRENSWGESIPVIILSTSALDEDIKESYDTKANAFMTKSSSLNEYQEDIRKAVLFFLRADTY